VPQALVGGDHLGGGKAGSEAAAQDAKRAISDAGHGRQHGARRDLPGTDLEAHRSAWSLQRVPPLASGRQG
jgi:hypothetical protein